MSCKLDGGSSQPWTCGVDFARLRLAGRENREESIGTRTLAPAAGLVAAALGAAGAVVAEAREDEESTRSAYGGSPPGYRRGCRCG